MKWARLVTPEKPLGIKSYGHIPHLSGSRMGPVDHTCQSCQARIATQRVRDRFDQVVVLEILDGSNVGVARLGNEILALGRSGYRVATSRYEQHRHVDRWVRTNVSRFLAVLQDGERLCGEWLF